MPISTLNIFTDIRCDDLATPANGMMSCSSGRVGVGYKGDTCSFTCNTGYELTGSDHDTRTCQSNGSWNGTDALCRRGKSVMLLLVIIIMYVKTVPLNTT